MMFKFERELVVEWGDCDPAGIVYNPRFLAYFDTSTGLLLAAATGMPKPQMIKTYDIIGIPIVKASQTFSAPARYYDAVVIRSEVTKVGRASFDIRHRLFKDEGLCVEGEETRVWTARDPETGKLGSRPLPDEVSARLRGEG